MNKLKSVQEASKLLATLGRAHMVSKVPAPVEWQELEDEKGKPRRDIDFRRGWNACRKAMMVHYEKLWNEREVLEGKLADAESMERIVQELDAEHKWAPIEEADQDGQALLLYDPELVNLDFNPEGVVEGAWMHNEEGEEAWMGAVWNGCHDLWTSVEINPTHFQHKPLPPAYPGEYEQTLAEDEAKCHSGFPTGGF